MKQLATLTDSDIFEGAVNKSSNDFYKRQAARAIVFNESGQVYLLHMSNYGYHKLPGGGVDDGEDMPTALFRELKEEIGCPAEITGEVGEIRELRSEMGWDQISYCYLAKQNGELVPTELEPSEIAQGAETVIAESIDAAIELLEKDSPVDYEGKFIKQRDLIFLRRAQEFI
ncbi:MAG TPA: NUDIX domain-containing protein [Candidatus Saccharimonadales bacterium]